MSKNNTATKIVGETMKGVTLTPGEGAKLIVDSYLNGTFKRTLLFRGSPGIGKSSLAKAAAEELRKTFPDFQYVEINPTMPAEEVGGIPDLIRVEGQATRTDYALPAWFPTKAEKPNWKGIINLDDALQGDRMMQQTLANLILARNLRGHELPDGAMIVATGNRVEDKAGVTRALTHFADRMCWINIEAEPMAWVEQFAIPNGLSEKVIGYILFDKDKLDMFDPNKEKCPTPRTWAAVSNWVKYLDTLKNPDQAQVRDKLAHAVLSGELGEGEATSFWAFCDMWGKLPDIDHLLKNPDTANIDYELSVQYALVLAIAQRLDTNTFGAALKYIDRIGPDLTTLAIKIGTKNKPELRQLPEWQTWAAKNQALLF